MKSLYFLLLVLMTSIVAAQNPWVGETRWYSVIEEPGVTYTWAVPSDWAILSGQGSDSVSVLVGSMSGYVTVTPSNACGEGPSQERYLEPQDSSSTSLSDPEALRLKYYPNPVKDKLVIEMPANWKVESISFFDLKCSQYFIPVSCNGQIFEAELGFLEAGVYHMKIAANGRQFNYKIIKN